MHTVILVDDDPFIVDGLNVLIDWNALGLEVIGKAHNGLEAYNLYQKHPADIIITDIKMPEMSGIELIEKIKADNEQCKFIILSGFNDFEYVKEGIRLGIDNYLTKPVNMDELQDTLKTATEILDKQTKPSSFSVNTDELNMLLNTILYRCVTGKISIEEVINRADLLSITVDSSNYLVVLIRAIPNQDGDIVSEDILHDNCLKVPNILEHAMIFNDLSGDLVIIFHGNSDPSAFMSVTNALLEKLTNRFKAKRIPIQATIGTLVNSFREIQKSYSQALSLFDYFLVHPSKTVLELEDIIAQEHSQPFDIDHDLISKLVAEADLDGLNIYIDSLFNSLSLHSISNPDIPRIIVMEIFIQLSRTKNYMLDSNELFLREIKFLSELHEVTDINDLKRRIKQVFADLFKYISQQNMDMNPIICEIIKHLQTHLSEDLSLKKYSVKYNINPTYLGQLFKKETGISFPKYLNNYRIEKAKSLLLESHDKTANIAKKVGYSDPNYFYRTFKKYVGLSPSDFKKR